MALFTSDATMAPFSGELPAPDRIWQPGFWLCEIPLAWYLAYRAGWGVRGVFAAIPIAELFITLMGLAMFMRGSWKRRAI